MGLDTSSSAIALDVVSRCWVCSLAARRRRRERVQQAARSSRGAAHTLLSRGTRSIFGVRSYLAMADDAMEFDAPLELTSLPDALQLQVIEAAMCDTSDVDEMPLQGRRVILQGLASKPELNGATGKAVSFDADKGRYGVMLDTDETAKISLKPANLRCQPCRSKQALQTLRNIELVCSQWQSLSRDDELWSRLCKARFGLETKTPPLRIGQLHPSALTTFKEAARAWLSLCAELEFLESQFALSGLPNEGEASFSALWNGAVRTWDALSAQTEAILPAVHATLAPPADAATWREFVAELSLPAELAHALLPLRMLTQQHDGQALQWDHTMAQKNGAIGADAVCPISVPPQQERAQIFHGLVGGYSAYDHLVSTRLFPLKLIAGWTNLLRREDPSFPPNALVIAASFRLDKMFVFDATTSRLALVERNRHGPPTLRRAVPEDTPTGADLHRWLGELASRMASGQLIAEPLVPLDENSRGLSSFPRSGPRLSRAVTRGIEAEGSSVYDPVQGCFLYSIRLRLLPQGEPGAMSAAERGFETAQLRGRHWILRDANGQEDHVHGDGVVGRYPLLREGGWREDEQRGRSFSPSNLSVGEEMEGIFIYQSMSGRGNNVSFGGELLLVPGDLRNPTGEEFALELPPFSLVVPEYIY